MRDIKINNDESCKFDLISKIYIFIQPKYQLLRFNDRVNDLYHATV